MRQKIFRLILITLFFHLFLSGLSLGVVAAPLKEAKPSRQAEYLADEVVVKFKRRVTPGEIDQFNRVFETRFTRTRRFADFATLRIPTGLDAKMFAERLAADPRVEYAEPNYIAHALMIPNDPYYSYQWHFHNSDYGGVQAEQAWDISTGTGVTVAIIDTGIAYENYRPRWRERYEIAPDLAGSCFVAGHDFVNSDSHANDDHGHGTHVAGTVAQRTNNNLGTAGLAHSACLMPVKVLDAQGRGTYADIAEGIRFAADNGARVINLSLGGEADAAVLREAVAYAHGDKKVTIVAAAGNNGSSTVLYPAAYDGQVIAVGATRYDKTLTSYSSHGPSLDLVAPGGDLSVDQNGDGYGDGILQQTFDKDPQDWGYWFYQGTSMASPHVAAVAAMVIANGTFGPESVRAALEGSAEDLGSPGRDNTYGWGLVDAAGALGAASGPSLTPTPTLTLTPTATPSSTLTPTPTSAPTSTPTATPTAGPEPTPTPTPTLILTPTPTSPSSPTPSSTPTPTNNPVSETICWRGDYQFLYRSNSQAQKFCKCAQGNYGYNSYHYTRRRGTAYQLADTGDNENWAVSSRSSSRSIDGVTCLDGAAYPADQDYRWPK